MQPDAARRADTRESAGDEDRGWLADANASLFLSILQSIPYQSQRDVFDWDHIFPQNQASLMWSPGPEGRWRRHHPHRHLVGSAGNLWGLDARANRTAKDLLPGAKFTLIEHESERRGWRVWPRERWWLTGDEIAEFSEIGRRLEAGHDIDAAMDRFRALVTHRALRMTTEVFAKLPEAELFAADNGGAGAEASRSPRIAEALGVEIPRPVRTGREPIAPAGPDQRVEQVLLLADQRGTGGVLRDLVARATALRLQVRGYQSTITLTPPTTRVIALVALGPHERRAGLVTTWVNPRAFADHFASVPAERFDEELGGIRGSLLDGVAVADLADRLERLLGPVLGSGLTEGA